MNNRLVSRVKALNYTVDNFPIFTDENSERYIDLKSKLTSSLMRRDIKRVVKKYPNRPKLKKKLLNMCRIYNESTDNEIINICCEDIAALPTASDITSKHDELVSVLFNSGPLINPMSKNSQEFLDWINKFKE